MSTVGAAAPALQHWFQYISELLLHNSYPVDLLSYNAVVCRLADDRRVPEVSGLPGGQEAAKPQESGLLLHTRGLRQKAQVDASSFS